jgi:hypothetical protein
MLVAQGTFTDDLQMETIPDISKHNVFLVRVTTYGSSMPFPWRPTPTSALSMDGCDVAGEVI